MNEKFVVIKIDDIHRYLTKQQEDNLKDILDEMHECREHDHRLTDKRYFVINQNEPYANEVKEIMKRYGHWDD